MDADRQNSPPPKTRRVSRWFAAALILINVVVIGYFLAPQTVGEQVRRKLEAKLQAHYKHLDVRIASGRVASDGMVVLGGIEFRSRGRSTAARPILQIATLTAYADIQFDKLLDGSMPVCPQRIVADGVIADLWQDATGRWSAELLWPPLVMNDRCPRLEIRDGRVRLHGSADDPSRPLEIDQIEAAIDLMAHGAVAEDSVDKAVRPGDSERRSDRENAKANTSALLRSIGGRFTLSAAGEFVDSVSIDGEFSDGMVKAKGGAVGLRIDPTLLARIPFLSPQRLRDVRDLSLTTDVSGSVDCPLASLAGDSSPTFGFEWTIRDGRFDHTMLPQPLENLTGQVATQPDGLEVRWAQATFGDASLRLSATSGGWGDGAALDARLNASGLMVSERLANKLPPRISKAWNQIRPHGPIDLELKLQRRGDVWSSEGTAELLGVDVQLSSFPYPVAQLIGSLQFDDTTVRTKGLSGRVSGQRLNVAFEQKIAGLKGPSWLQFAADGPVSIDSPLLASLTPLGQPTSNLERFVRSLSPSGSLHLVAARFDRDAEGKTRKSLDLRVTGGSLRYKQFPYPLYDVRGQITVNDDWVQLIGFQASNSDNARILCDGSFLGMPDESPHPTDGQWQVALRFRGRDLPLDETLRAALAPRSRDLWDHLSPTGVLDDVELTLHHAQAWPEPKMVVSANQFPRPTIDSRTLSLRVADIPYRIDVVEGAVRFDGQQVTIRSLDGRHDSTRITADGRCIPTETGQWLMELNVHSGSRVHPDAELIGSLPAEVRGAFQRLQLRGPVSARGTVGVLLPDERHTDPTIRWDVVLQLEGNRIGEVGPVRDLRGEITLRGARDATSVVAQGVVSIDSMHIERQQITEIRGPFGIRDDRLYLGESMTQLASANLALPPPPASAASGPPTAPTGAADPSKPRPIQGKLFGGQVSLSGEVLLSDGGFDILVSINDADLATVMIETGQTDAGVRGKAKGQVRLEGVVGASHLLKGAGSASLSEANLYQLPLLISVFNMLRVKPSEAVAFTDGTARFSVYGNTATFNELKLWGDLIALDGSGTINRSQEVDLSFNTRVSPQNAWSIITSPFGESRYTLWTLYVRGSLANPQIERRAMDAVGGTLERLLPGISGADEPPQTESRMTRLRERLTR
jgi:hypothetical protein